MEIDLDHPDPTKKTAASHPSHGAAKGHPEDVKGLNDAAALAKRHVDFTQPSVAQIKALKPGRYVKLARNGERFWVKMTGYVGRKYHGAVANDVQKNWDLPASPIFFYRKNIYCVRED